MRQPNDRKQTRAQIRKLTEGINKTSKQLTQNIALTQQAVPGIVNHVYAVANDTMKILQGMKTRSHTIDQKSKEVLQAVKQLEKVKERQKSRIPKTKKRSFPKSVVRTSRSPAKTTKRKSAGRKRK